MAKSKDKGPKGVPNKHLHARVSFLHQAATYLNIQTRPTSDGQATAELRRRDELPGIYRIGSNRQPGTEAKQANEASSGCENSVSTFTIPTTGGLPSHLTSQLRQVARKSQLRLHSSIKRNTCNVCSAVLTEGLTCKKYIENLSRGGNKPHADILVVECASCGSKKRFPAGANRQQRKGLRAANLQTQNQPASLGDTQLGG